MSKEYSMSNKVAIRMLVRIAAFVLLSVLMVVGVFKLGLPQWKSEQYKWVSVGMLAIFALSASMLISAKDVITCQNKIPGKSIAVFATFAGVAVVLWVIETIMDKHYEFAALNLVLNLILIVAQFIRNGGVLKNLWRTSSSTYDAHDNKVKYPGEYVLNDVLCGETLLDPWGKVLIQGNSVLFVNVDPYWGYAFADTSGSLDVYKRKGLNGGEVESDFLSEATLKANGQSGLDRIKRIVKTACAQKGVQEPDMVYDYMVFLPRFEENPRVYTEYNFANLPASKRLFMTYEKYLKNVPGKYFGDKVCYNVDQLQHVLNSMNAEYKRTHPVNAVAGDGQLVADCIAEECELVPCEENRKKKAAA